MTHKKQIRKKHFLGSVNAINERRDEIKKIIAELKKQGIPVNRYTVYERLDKTKFDVSISTVYNDIVAISRDNTWVRDLTESTYSAYQEDINDTLNWIQKEARSLYDKTWSHRKDIYKKIPTKNGNDKIIYQAVKSQEEYKPKATLLKIILDVQDLKMKHTNGQNINVSASLLGKKFEKAKVRLKEQEELAAQTTAAAFMDLKQNELFRN